MHPTENESLHFVELTKNRQDESANYHLMNSSRNVNVYRLETGCKQVHITFTELSIIENSMICRLFFFFSQWKSQVEFPVFRNARCALTAPADNVTYVVTYGSLHASEYDIVGANMILKVQIWYWRYGGKLHLLLYATITIAVTLNCWWVVEHMLIEHLAYYELWLSMVVYWIFYAWEKRWWVI